MLPDIMETQNFMKTYTTYIHHLKLFTFELVFTKSCPIACPIYSSVVLWKIFIQHTISVIAQQFPASANTLHNSYCMLQVNYISYHIFYSYETINYHLTTIWGTIINLRRNSFLCYLLIKHCCTIHKICHVYLLLLSF